jgi:hypothetical protein
LLHNSSRILKRDIKSVYLNCEDFKRHSFPNVLIEILSALFRELDRNLYGWFGKKKKSRNIIRGVIKKLADLQRAADVQDEDIKRKNAAESDTSLESSAGVDIDHLRIKLGSKEQSNERQEVERSFKIRRDKLQELDRWLPELKEDIREFFKLSNGTSAIILQLDDLYHLRRADQAFVVDYITDFVRTFHFILRLLHCGTRPRFTLIATANQ